MRKYALEITVFVCGMMVMVLELVGSRVVAPYLGTSLIVWTSLIGIVLGSLSLGYWWGGRLADQQPSFARLAAIIAAAAGTIIAMVIYKEGLLTALSSSSLDLRLQTLFASLGLFVIPSTLLGMVSPYAAKLRLTKLEHSGTTIGNLSALSTLGSIVGTFLTGFVLLAYIGSTYVLVLIACILTLNAFMLAAEQYILPLLMIPLIASATLFNQGYVRAQEQQGIRDVDTTYNRVRIIDGVTVDSNQRIRLMRIANEASSGMYIDNTALLYEYTKRYRITDYFSPDPQEVLMIGGAAYSYPKDFLAKHPGANLDVVEIDPKLTDLARQFFNLPTTPNLKVYHEDGRTFLNRNQKKYDAILGDAYTSIYSLPYQLTTREAAERIKASLTDRGVYVVNIIGSLHGTKSAFLQAEYTTLAAVFPQVYVFPVGGIPIDPEQMQNVMVVALPYAEELSMETADPELNDYLQERWPVTFDGSAPLLTDDYAPVDLFASRIILR